MPDSSYLRPIQNRMSSSEWKDLVHGWRTRRDDVDNPCSQADQEAWVQHIKDKMPLSVREPDLGNFAVELDDPILLDIIYSGITPSGHVSHHIDQGIGINRLIFDGLLRFRARFGTKLSTGEVALMLRHILEQDDPGLLDLIPDVNEQLLFMALRSEPSLLEYTGARMAPVMAEFLEGWVKFSSGKLLSVFLICCGEGRVKSISAMISAGFNPFHILNGKAQSWANPIQKAILFHDKETGRSTFPQSFLDVLGYLDPDTDTSNHIRVKFGALDQKGATQKFLSGSSENRIAGTAKQDWRVERRIAS